MSMSNQDEQKPLADEGEGLCAEVFGVPQATHEFRTGLLRQTRAAVRARPRRRRLLVAGAVCLAYVAGIATVTLLGLIPVAPPNGVVTEIAQTRAAPSSPDEPEILLARVPDAERAEQIRLLTKAGDLYLDVRGDVEGALYCYRQVLELAPANQALAVEQNDSWLLASLKQARIQETTHENHRS
jgi:cytochrome c-type biogenesis protein CcmH/NrfG